MQLERQKAGSGYPQPLADLRGRVNKKNHWGIVRTMEAYDEETVKTQNGRDKGNG